MNHALKLFVMLLFVGYLNPVQAQIEQPIIINNTNIALFNPAFAGIEEETIIGTRSTLFPIYDLQNLKFSNAINFNTNWDKINSGLGFDFVHSFYHHRVMGDIEPLNGYKETYINHFFLKLKYNYNFKLGKETSLRVGALAGLIIGHKKINREKPFNSTTKNYNHPDLSAGIRLAHQQFYVGGSLNNLMTRKNYFNGMNAQFNVGYYWELFKNLSVEPNLQIIYTEYLNIPIKIQTKIIFYEKYFLGGGMSVNTSNTYQLLAGIHIKEKLGLNLAHQRFMNSIFGVANNSFEFGLSYTITTK